MGKFKESVRDVFGQLFRHSDMALALDGEHVDWDGLHQGQEASEPGPTQRARGAPPLGRVQEGPAPELMETGAMPPVVGPIPSPASNETGPLLPYRRMPLRLQKTMEAPPAASVTRTRLKKASTSTRSRVRATASQTLWLEGASPQSRSLSSTRASKTLAPVRGGQPLPQSARMGPPPRNFWDDSALRLEILAAIDDELRIVPRDGAEARVLLALRPRMTGPLAELPPLPAVAGRLLSPDHAPDDDEMVRLIREDAGLAGRIVRLANSPFYLSVMPVGSIQAALLRIGLNECRRIVILAALEAALVPPGSVEAQERLRRHGVATAHVAESLASSFESDPGEAFLAGLLHDSGEALIRRAVGVGPSAGPEEEAAVATVAALLHQRVGTLLFAHWDLPAAIAGAIAAHHHPEMADPRFARLAWLVHVADPLAERALEHARSEAWLGAVEALEAGATEAAHRDGISGLDVRELARALPGGIREKALHQAARTALLRLRAMDGR